MQCRAALISNSNTVVDLNTGDPACSSFTGEPHKLQPCRKLLTGRLGGTPTA